MAEASRTRYGFVDALRGYVILLVVVCHVSGGVRNAGIAVPDWILEISTYSYSFFMSLMFLLSGLFIESAIRKGPREYALGHLRTLVYPFVIWTFVNGGVGLLAARYANHPVGHDVLGWFLWSPVEALWFIEALILCQVAYGALRFVGLGRWPVALVGVVLAFVAPHLPDGILALSANAFGFFAFGAAASEAILSGLTKRSAAVLLGLAVVFEAGHVWLLRAGWPPALAPLVSVCGLVAPLCVGAAFGNGRAFAPLRTLGEASLAIFVLHTTIAAAIRIVLQKAIHLSAPWPHLALVIGAALVISVMVWNLSLKRFPQLFRLPAKRVPLSDGAA